MNKIDLFVISAPNFDSPIIRDFIHKYHDKFNKIYYLFSYSDHFFRDEWKPIYEFVKQDLDGKCEFINVQASGDITTDWRDECVQQVLKRSTGDYIFSIEPDIIGDWEKIVDMMLNQTYELFSVVDHNLSGIRLWPCFWGCRKSLLSKIKYPKFCAPVDDRVKKLYQVDYNKKLIFEGCSALDAIDISKAHLFYKKYKIVNVENETPKYYDHFDLVSTQLFDLIQDDGKQLLLLNRFEQVYFRHYMGISHDYLTMFEYNRKARDPQVFTDFYNDSIKTDAKLHPQWLEVSKKILNT